MSGGQRKLEVLDYTRRHSGIKLVTLPPVARQGAEPPLEWSGAASTPCRVQLGSGGLGPARLACNKEKGAGFLGRTVGPVRGNLGKSRACTCRATLKGGTAHTAAPPWPA